MNHLISKSFFFIASVLLLNCETARQAKTTDRTAVKKEEQGNKVFSNPVFEPVLADPSVVFDPEAEKFYAYGTEDNWADGQGNRLVPILESKDLVEWEYVGEAFKTKPDWKKAGGIWAPDINRVKGKYYLYYAFSTWGDKNPGIGLAISESPKGPFIDQRKLFDSRAVGVPNSIDPFYYAEDDKKYIFWGSFSNSPTQGTYAMELSGDGKKVKDLHEKTKIAAGDFEAVMIHKHDGYYYFFGSKGACCEGKNSSYRVLVARSEDLTGPYKDKEGRNIAERGNGTLLLEGSKEFVGPGHTSDIVTDKKGQDWILYHAIVPEKGKLSNGTTRRVLMLDPVKWREGWPYIENREPSSSAAKKPAL